MSEVVTISSERWTAEPLKDKSGAPMLYSAPGDVFQGRYLKVRNSAGEKAIVIQLPELDLGVQAADGSVTPRVVDGRVAYVYLMLQTIEGTNGRERSKRIIHRRMMADAQEQTVRATVKVNGKERDTYEHGTRKGHWTTEEELFEVLERAERNERAALERAQKADASNMPMLLAQELQKLNQASAVAAQAQRGGGRNA